jgi:5-hydroxytryptamine receptor 1
MNNITAVAPPPWHLVELVSIAMVLITLILTCIIGNLFVILAIVLERDLRSRPQYWLVFSLACADLLVGLAVTPLGAWSTIAREWSLGVALCDFWISVDVLVCTSSILHLVAIALDRYWSITDICYIQQRTPRRIASMLACVWIVSLLISLAPILGWKDERFRVRVEVDHVCLISQQISYQVFSTATAFYIPLCAIVIIYYKIFRAAKRRFKRERDRRTVYKPSSCKQSARLKTAIPNNPAPEYISTTTIPATGSRLDLKTTTSNSDNSNCSPDDEDNERTPIRQQQQLTNGATVAPNVTVETETRLDTKIPVVAVVSNPRKRQVAAPKKESPESKRERKAWRTLAIITGCFLISWTPFFLVALYRPICGCDIHPAIESITSWLGYTNSGIVSSLVSER